MKNVTSGNIESGFRTVPPLKTDVMQWLLWSDFDYSDCQFESGMLYLETYLGGDASTIHLLSNSKVFWAWWRNQWNRRDESFKSIMTNVIIRDIEVRREIYRDYNDGEKLVKEIHPNTVVLHESYTEMVGAVIKAKQS
jgi:hypothetical protein